MHFGKKIPLILALSLSISISSFGQNLINNPGFELNSGGIATLEGNFNKVDNWDEITPTPDYIGANNSLYPYYPRPNSGQFYALIVSDNADPPTVIESIGQTINLSESINYRIKVNVSSLGNRTNSIAVYGLKDKPPLLNNFTNMQYFKDEIPLWTSDAFTGDSLWHTLEGCFKTNKEVNYLLFAPVGRVMWIAIDDITLEQDQPTFSTSDILPNDTIICNNLGGFELKPKLLDNIINWSDSSTGLSMNVETSGKYYITGYKNQCMYSDTISIRFLESPKVELPKDTFLCDEESILISAKTVDSLADSIVWNIPNTGLSAQIGEAGLYWIEVSNACGTARDSIIIKQYYSPKLELGEPIENCENIEIELDAYQEEIMDYLWSDGSISSKNTITNNNIGLTVSNYCGSAWDSLIVENYNCECKVFVPNAFTPTKDALNERFALISNCTDVLGVLTVYNRWGEKLFETTDLFNGWDGYYQNTQTPGVYLGIFEIKLPNNSRKVISQTFHLIK
jgi:gliding motility-associated-like protein